MAKLTKKAAKGCTMTEENVDYICDFYSYSIIGTTLHWMKEGMPPYREDLMKRCSQSFEVTIEDMVRFYSKHETVE